MQLSARKPNPHYRARRNGMGFLPELMSLASSFMDSASGGGSGSPGSSSPAGAAGGAGGAGGQGARDIQVSPAIQTQVSPQISPVFQQQFQPSNSGMTAGTSQYLPTNMSAPNSGMPGAQTAPGGSLPGSGGAYPANYPGQSYQYPPSAIPGPFTSGAETGGFQKYLPYLLLGGAGLLGVFFMMRKKRAA
jgi:hypothetical protein